MKSCMGLSVIIKIFGGLNAIGPRKKLVGMFSTAGLRNKYRPNILDQELIHIALEVIFIMRCAI